MPVWFALYIVGMLITILLFIHEFRKTDITFSNNKKNKIITTGNPSNLATIIKNK